jgi:flagellar hook protein FlgE
MSAFTTAISGINAAFTQLGVSADNVARRNVPYAEKNRVIQNSTPNGEIQTQIQVVPIPANERVDENSLEYSTSNIDYAEEFINQMTDTLAARVNLRTFETAKKMDEALLSIRV